MITCETAWTQAEPDWNEYLTGNNENISFYGKYFMEPKVVMHQGIGTVITWYLSVLKYCRFVQCSNAFDHTVHVSGASSLRSLYFFSCEIRKGPIIGCWQAIRPEIILSDQYVAQLPV